MCIIIPLEFSLNTGETKIDSSKCEKCQVNDACDDHTCPYAEEINNDSESTCNCCDECTQECAMDI